MSRSVSKANNDILNLLSAKSVNTKKVSKKVSEKSYNSLIVKTSDVQNEKTSKSKSLNKTRKSKKAVKEEKDKEEFTAETTHETIIMHLPIAPENIDLIEQQFSEDRLLQYNPNINDPKPYSNVYDTVYGSSTGMIIDSSPDEENMSTSLEFLDISRSEISPKGILTSQNLQKDNTKEQKTLTEDIDIENILQKRETDVIIIDKEPFKQLKKEKIREDYNQYEDKSSKDYFQVLPNIYSVNEKEWPKRTNIWCWWCCHSFDSVPIPCPKKYNKSQKKFMVYGCFCSFNCVLSYNDYSHVSSKNSYMLIKGLQRAMTSESSEIIPAPPRQSLKVFGGKLTIQEFRRSFKNGIVYSFMQFPFMPYTQYIETVFKSRDNFHAQSSGYYVKDDDVSKASPILKSNDVQEEKRIRLKRNKPLPQANNTLDALLKLRK